MKNALAKLVELDKVIQLEYKDGVSIDVELSDSFDIYPWDDGDGHGVVVLAGNADQTHDIRPLNERYSFDVTESLYLAKREWLSPDEENPESKAQELVESDYSYLKEHCDGKRFFANADLSATMDDVGVIYSETFRVEINFNGNEDLIATVKEMLANYRRWASSEAGKEDVKEKVIEAVGKFEEKVDALWARLDSFENK